MISGDDIRGDMLWIWIGDTAGYSGIQSGIKRAGHGDTAGCSSADTASGKQRNTVGYNGIQRDTAGYGMVGDTAGYSGIQIQRDNTQKYPQSTGHI
jgi:hypothetical protein